MIAPCPLPSNEPFAEDAAGFAYFSTDFHYRYVAAAIFSRIAKTRGFVLVSGDPAPDGELLLHCLNREKAAEYRATLIQCRPAMGFEDLVRQYRRQLGITVDDEGNSLWPLLSHLMMEARNGLTRVLVIENADVLDDKAFDELHRFVKIDDPNLLPVVLLSSPSFATRLAAPPLRFLKSAVVAHLPLQRLERGEVPAFIHYQMNAIDGDGENGLSAETIDAIASAAKGDAVLVNHLARGAWVPVRRPDPVPALLQQASEPDEADVAVAAAMTLPADVGDAVRPEKIRPTKPVEQPNVSELSATAAASTVEKLPDPPRRRWRGIASGLAAAAYLLVAIISGGTLLYILVPSSGSKFTAEATVPQSNDSHAFAFAMPAPDVKEPSNTDAEKLRVAALPVPAEEPPAPPSDIAGGGAAIEPPAPSLEPSNEADSATGPSTLPAAAPPLTPPQQIFAAIEPAAAPPPVPRIVDRPPAADIVVLVQRGDQLLAAGDIISARRFFERAAESGDAAAAYGLGKSYDPLFLQQAGARGVPSDLAKAAAWYRRAAGAGNAEAATRLKQLLSTIPK